MLVHRVTGGHESNHTAGAHLVERFGKEIIVDRETEPVIGTVVYLVLAERHITDGEVVKVPPVSGLKSGNGNVCFGVELFCNSARDAVQLYAVEPAVLHYFGQTAEKIADAHGRLQDVAGLESHPANGFIDGLDDSRACVVGVQRRASCGCVFFGREQFF